MKIGDLVRYIGTRDDEYLGIITKDSRTNRAAPYNTEYYVVWQTVDNSGWWTADLLKKAKNENR